MVKKILSILSVRHRHVLTRQGRLRLRFMAGPLAMAAVCFLTTQMFTAGDMQGARNGKPVQVAKQDGFPYTAEEHARFFGAIEGVVGEGAPVNESGIENYELALDAPIPRAVPAIRGTMPKYETVEISPGDVLTNVLIRAGLDSNLSQKAVEALKDHLDPREIRPGQSVTVKFDPTSSGDYKFSEMTLAVNDMKSVFVQEDGATMKAGKEEIELRPSMEAKSATVEVSLYGSALKSGIPSTVIADAIHIFSWDVDFQRDLRKGDQIELLYEKFVSDDGSRSRYGKILAARLVTQGREIPAYRYEMADGFVDYYNGEGKSLRKALLKTPIDGARISSSFGMRKHPILGYNKMHKGMDFAAPAGTPIYAAGDGVIEKVEFQRGYGNYVRIRHNSGMKTAYAHMSRFAKSSAVGKRVKQGDVIGFVGATGAATGAHLHYEVLVGNKQVNPTGVKIAQGTVLAGGDLKKFKAMAKDRDSEFKRLIQQVDRFARNTYETIVLADASIR